jgi:hypothetical protein
MSRVLLVEGKKVFRVIIPDEAKLTFGPWSPPNAESKYNGNGEKALSGTLRVYENDKAKASILAVFSGVNSYRDISSIEYEEQIFVEKGSTVWQSDQNGYKREEAVDRTAKWVDPQLTSGEENDS